MIFTDISHQLESSSIFNYNESYLMSCMVQIKRRHMEGIWPISLSKLLRRAINQFTQSLSHLSFIILYFKRYNMKVFSLIKSFRTLKIFCARALSSSVFRTFIPIYLSIDTLNRFRLINMICNLLLCSRFL